ncbi:methyl-accepting chemotaxis protein [Oleiphilus messinensis]|uniref:Methyl-accepting chemotaxis protein n=1 Tax=Oleiphilus messinensis TaxID=141451 RepID=A0A1Y0IE68_9GAMM|nr:methyl-accepting chemotaxis protein [Oleiphilus messinensis]ARU58469.1 methyl-accepting chemotaxis protein [Oleiphilus messinensis]
MSFLKQIGIKLVILVVCILTLILIGFGFNDYRNIKVSLEKQMERQSGQALHRLSRSLPGLVWNFESDQMENVLLSESNANFVQGILIRDLKDKVIKGIYNELEGDEKKASPYGGQNWDGRVLKSALEFDDYGDKKPVGSVEIWIDERHIEEQLTAQLWRSVAETVFLDVIVALVLLFAARALVDRPLIQVIEALRDIAEGDGDLTKRLPTDRQDQLGDLAVEFNRFFEKIRALVVETRSSMKEMETWVNKVTTSAVDIGAELGDQHAEIDQVTAATHELSIASQTVADNARQAADSVGSADKAASEANEIVQSAIEAIHQLAHEIDTGAVAVDSLQKDVANITSVLAVIRGIAEQTNLLALNAAIEAARAGEMGRGFAVVADEVRALASRTQEATEEIQSMIEKLQGGAQKAVTAMTTSKDRSQDNVEMSTRTGDALQQIAEAMKVISDMSVQIASATEEQRTVCDDVSRNLTQITTIASNITGVSQQSVDTASSLQSLNHKVVEAFDRFRV